MEPRELLVGLTYDLRADYADLGLDEEQLAEFDGPETIAALERALAELGHRVDRVGNVKALARRLVAGDRWDLVFNIAEGRFGSGREAQVPALLDAYEIPYTFSDPLASAATLHKATTKRLLRDHGLPTPGFALVSSLEDLEGLELGWPRFAKPVAEGTSKGIDAQSVLRTPEELREVCERLLLRYQQDVLVEEFLPGREFTVGLVGTGRQARSAGALEVDLLGEADRDVYTYRNKEECETLVRYSLAADATARAAEGLALAAWRALDCRDGGRVDLRCDAQGRPQIIEVNPLPGMHPTHSDLPILWQQGGRSYLELVRTIMASACERSSESRLDACAS
ncbi:D-alanine--D-alanine ligase family protein [Engelhardtia mirabilis]|uniref:D-alanine--D-alanine ligase n=1 Tax=Engelhardtia mirabilis TaxID=2528011 RepID=A0A518BF83_9BACT|nr:Ddl-like protein [Planctomycetes bacterium Pla133]QDU99966.1 Ddl-like protein [Planctomycetes bacterium Pla86]